MCEKSLIEISSSEKISLRTFQRWKRHYQEDGLIGLVRRTRCDVGHTRIDSEVISEIERLFLTYRKMSLATIHRKIIDFCATKQFKYPSYNQVYRIIKVLPSSIKVLAHDGDKAYSFES